MLEKVYFEDCSFNDIKEYIFPALREIRNLEEMYENLFNSIKSYSDVKNKKFQLFNFFFKKIEN